MFKLLAMYIVLNQCLAEPLLDELYGARGTNRVTICISPDRACDGAVWDREWVVARDSCLGDAVKSDLFISKGEINCSNVGIENMVSRLNTAVTRYKPSYMDDVALLRLNQPYPAEEILNHTSADLLNKLNVFVNEINESVTQKEINKDKDTYYSYQYMKLNSSPIKMFLIAVILPSVAFMVFFLIVIFFTGSNKRKTSYRPLVNAIEKEATI